LKQRPVILYDAVNDARTLKENVGLLNISNGVCVPLVIEKRDEDTNKVTDRKVIGVMWSTTNVTAMCSFRKM